MECSICGKELVFKDCTSKKPPYKKYRGAYCCNKMNFEPSAYKTVKQDGRVSEFSQSQNTYTQQAKVDVKALAQDGKIGLAIDRAVEYCSQTHSPEVDIVTRRADMKEMAEFFLYLPEQLKDHKLNLNEEEI